MHTPNKANDAGDPHHETASEESGRYAFTGLDRVLHEKARLGILTSLLAHHDGLVFNELRDLCTLTDGNLSRHLTTLQEAGLVEICKGQKGKRTQTLVRLTAPGRQRFLDYLTLLEGILSKAMAAASQTPLETSLPGRLHAMELHPA